MLVIPAINCIDVECVREKVGTAKGFLPKGAWIHLDVADARFTFNRTWGNPGEWEQLAKTDLTGIQGEIHLMVEEPERVVGSWLEAGAKRVIVHVEAIKNSHAVNDILERCAKYGAAAMLAAAPETSVHHLIDWSRSFSVFQILAVNPGLAGQRFYHLAIEKIKYLRSRVPQAMIEVDGGITPETARAAKEAGADVVASASYIFDSESPRTAFENLVHI